MSEQPEDAAPEQAPAVVVQAGLASAAAAVPVAGPDTGPEDED